MNIHSFLNQQKNQRGPKDQNRMTTLNNNSSTTIRDISYYRNNENSNAGKMNMNNNVLNNNTVNNNKVINNTVNNNTVNNNTVNNNTINSNTINSNTMNNNTINSNAMINNMYNNSNNMNNNNYSLGLYIDNPQNAFVFDENDLKTLFSHYKGAKNIRILKDKAAAQITFNDQNMIQQVKKDINGLTINDIGTIRCIILNEGKVIEQFLPFSANDPSAIQQNSSTKQNSENTVNMLKKLASLLQPQNSANNSGMSSMSNMSNINNMSHMNSISSNNVNSGSNGNGNNGNNIAKKKNDNMNVILGKNQMKNKIMNHSNYNNNNNNNNSFNGAHNSKSDQNENPYATKRLSRIELIDIFGFPTEFDIMKKILGKNNSNIVYINEQTNNSVSIEIKGKPLNEAPVVERMHISISSDDIASYKKAIELIVKLLNSIYEEFCDFCYNNNYQVPENLSFKRHEYMYNSDGSTKYVGFKDKWHIMKENYKNDYTFKKNKIVQKNDKEKRINNNGFNAHSNSNITYNNQNAFMGDFKEMNYSEPNHGNFRNIKLNRTRDQML
ncbi:conserved Plasmodium protein, unknown function [Plasmodium malariae]|uniref:KHDC4/BBP-like KH-domain type I domain-containing protein n=1 Tax=Plasmodium malariae TaxID=5858 RepID=A0A1D3PBH0_PLAMA|nr:conserved Plasmodium protein, unknown function [Plasmodium malariae]SCN12404.1 conserved Plasmodium protein, unknown function [Plasmodium malariae]